MLETPAAPRTRESPRTGSCWRPSAGTGRHRARCRHPWGSSGSIRPGPRRDCHTPTRAIGPDCERGRSRINSSTSTPCRFSTISTRLMSAPIEPSAVATAPSAPGRLGSRTRISSTTHLHLLAVPTPGLIRVQRTHGDATGLIDSSHTEREHGRRFQRWSDLHQGKDLVGRHISPLSRCEKRRSLRPTSNISDSKFAPHLVNRSFQAAAQGSAAPTLDHGSCHTDC